MIYKDLVKRSIEFSNRYTTPLKMDLEVVNMLADLKIKGLDSDVPNSMDYVCDYFDSYQVNFNRFGRHILENSPRVALVKYFKSRFIEMAIPTYANIYSVMEIPRPFTKAMILMKSLEDDNKPDSDIAKQQLKHIESIVNSQGINTRIDPTLPPMSRIELVYYVGIIDGFSRAFGVGNIIECRPNTMVMDAVLDAADRSENDFNFMDSCDERDSIITIETLNDFVNENLEYLGDVDKPIGEDDMANWCAVLSFINNRLKNLPIQMNA